MKGDSFLELKDLVRKMRPYERDAAKRFINTFDSNITRGNSKSLKLFKLVISNPEISWEKAKRRISRDAKERSFDKLVTRLKEKLTESMLLSINTEKQGAYSVVYQKLFDNRKKLMESVILNTRGLTKSAFRLLDEVIRDSKKYELYDILVEALSERQRIEGLRAGKKIFNKYSGQIVHYERCRNAKSRAEKWNTQHLIELTSSGLKSEKIGFLIEAISDLKAEYDYTKSSSVGYFFYKLTIEYYFSLEEYQKCCDLGLELAALIEISPAIYRRTTLGAANVNLADNLLYIYNFDQSEERAKVSEELFARTPFNLKAAQEVRFNSLFYGGRFDEALVLIEDLLGRTKEREDPINFSKRSFYKANVLFMLKRYRESYLLLNDTREIEKDKEGWNIGRRVLSIMNHIEMMLLDVADSEIESMRKHISRIRESRNVRPRDKIILQLFILLERNSFHFDKVYEEHQSIFEKLESTDKEYRWEIKTPEMVVFHRWFKAKAEGKEYQFEIPENLLSLARESKTDDAIEVKAQDVSAKKPVPATVRSAS